MNVKRPSTIVGVAKISFDSGVVLACDLPPRFRHWKTWAKLLEDIRSCPLQRVGGCHVSERTFQRHVLRNVVLESVFVWQGELRSRGSAWHNPCFESSCRARNLVCWNRIIGFFTSEVKTRRVSRRHFKGGRSRSSGDSSSD